MSDSTSLTSISIPDSVTSIGNFAFYNCSNLERLIFLGKSLPELGWDCLTESNPVIYCYENSEVASWAKDQGYKIAYLDGMDLNDL